MAHTLLGKRRLVQAAIAVAIALALGGISAGQAIMSQMRSDDQWSPTHALIMTTPFWLFWAIAFPLVFVIGRKLPLRRDNLLYAIPLHLLLALVIAIAHYTVVFTFLGLIGHGTWAYVGHTWSQHWIPLMQEQLASHYVTYLLLLAGVFIWSNYQMYRERELIASQLKAQLSQARLQALRMQLNPHFLFNAMNSISMLVRRNDNAQAVKMLAGLSDLLRYVLEDSVSDEVPLSEELTFLKRYLDIERVRFGDRLTVKIDVSDEVRGAFVPNLILQPLVENAIRHGVARKVNPGTVEIAARKLGDRLILQVSDDGPGLSAPTLGGSGVGVQNTRARLEQMYGSDSSFELRAGAHGGAAATVSLPFHTRPRANDAGVNAA